jgi:hypothetical protein
VALARVVGLDPVPRGVDAFIAALNAMPRRAFIVEGLHRSFVRRVGGLAGIQALLTVMNATAHHHFWVVTIHRPAWDWLDSVGSPVDTGVFREVLNVAPWTASALQAWLEAGIQRGGSRLTYAGLVRQSAFGADPEVELERATDVFYRLLAEASGGHPSVAAPLFVACLAPSPDGLAVRLSDALSADVLTGLTDPALFVLVAIRLHARLRLDEVRATTNLAPGLVAATVRDLLARGLIDDDGAGLRLRDEHLQSVARTLRRRHFLHLGAA